MQKKTFIRVVAILNLLILFCNFSALAQDTFNNGQKKKMIVFLINQKEINDIDSNWTQYLNSMHYETFYKRKNDKIGFFCVNSAHSLRYIFIANEKDLVLLKTTSIDDDISYILDFVEKINVQKDSMATLRKVAGIYEYNKKANWLNK